MKTLRELSVVCGFAVCRCWHWTRCQAACSSARRPQCSSAADVLVPHQPCGRRLVSRQLRRRSVLSRAARAVARRASATVAATQDGAGRVGVDAEAGTLSTPARDRVQKPRVLSGVQPTGRLHLGNYLGAIQQWVTYQYDYDCWFCVVDLHAITVPQDPRQLAEDTLSTAAMYLACGLDPAHCRIFVQSQVPAHAELAWLLNCITPMGWLEKMTQYKDKRQRLGDDTSVYLGLFAYPVLMAADILLYRAERVPVGEDQRQHLELTRDLARAFNHTFCRKRKPHKLPSVFREPEALILSEGAGVARVMSLTDGLSKMSKSAPSDLSRINLLDDADTIRNKIRRCKTDTERELRFDDPARPECNNLLHIYRAITGNRSKAEIERELDALHRPGWAGFKELLAEALISFLSPIQERYAQVRKEPLFLEQVLERGRQEANLVANETLQAAKEAMGFAAPATARSVSLGHDGDADAAFPRPKKSSISSPMHEI
jgi:tryptophanyl-tRNA synthetase